MSNSPSAWTVIVLLVTALNMPVTRYLRPE